MASFPHLGFGLGLRPVHYPYIFEHTPKVDWFEIISENFMDTDGRPKRNLARIRELYPVVMHGVALSIGTVDPLNSEYLTKLKALIDFAEPAWVTDHLCWTGIAHRNTHDLLPVPYTEEALEHIVSRIGQVQDFLRRPIALENPSTYLEFNHSHIPEAEFIAAMARQSGCQLLLDVNNVYVSCYNHRLDLKAYIDAMPLDRVVQVHLSGHTNNGTHIVDTHDDHVIDEVWSLYRYATHQAGRSFNTMVEWDDKIPEFPVLMAELDKAKAAAATASSYAPLPELAAPTLPQLSNRPITLASSQQRMQDAILVGSTHDAGQWIRTKDAFPAEAQLAVYTNGYRYRLYDVTAQDYPVLKTYLGRKKFEKLIDDFIEAHPSLHFNVARYAAQLPDYIKANGDAFAHELAVLENAVAQLFDPPETTPLDPTQLAGISPEQWMESVLRPRTAMALHAFDYPVNDYYLAVKDGKKPKKSKPDKSYLAIFRHEDTVWRMPLYAQEFALLQKLFGGMPIAAALEAMQTTDTSEAALMESLPVWFSRWMRNGLLAA